MNAIFIHNGTVQSGSNTDDAIGV